MNNPFIYEPHPLCRDAARVVIDDIKAHIANSDPGKSWAGEMAIGKMFGVLLFKSRGDFVHNNTPESIERHITGTDFGYIAAYSGQLLGRSDWPGYVPPVFDYLQPDGYFKTEEAAIVNINNEIKRLEASPELAEAYAALEQCRRNGNDEIEQYRNFMAESKRKRKALRASSCTISPTAQDSSCTSRPFLSEPSAFDESSLIRESQHQKAELRRIKARVAAQTAEAEAALRQITDRIKALKDERRERSDALQRWLFSNFQMLNGRGESRNLLDIFSDWAKKTGSKCVIPPAGTGECCAPKLLQYAFSHGLEPVSIAEFWYCDTDNCTTGNAPTQASDIYRGSTNSLRINGKYYGACQSKCAPVLDWMLQGIDYEGNEREKEDETTTVPVVYENERVIVVDKPSGMLTVPGRSQRRSLYDILQQMRPDCERLMMVHRLDMDTSGLVIAAKDVETYRQLQALFLTETAEGSQKGVKKTYYAVLEGRLADTTPRQGIISLPLAADFENRPMQRVDHENGKPAITHYEIIGERDGHTILRLQPQTGRTHQLRVHCAHPEGLNMPILGDALYGNDTTPTRLHLHAAELEISFPENPEALHLKCHAPFLEPKSGTFAE